MTEEEKKRLEEQRKAEELARQLGVGKAFSNPVIPQTDDLGMNIQVPPTSAPTTTQVTETQVMPTTVQDNITTPPVSTVLATGTTVEATEEPKSQDIYQYIPGEEVVSEGVTEAPGTFQKFGEKEFVHTDRNYGNGEMLFRSLLGMGLAFLGARALGADSSDAGGAAILAGMHTLGNDMHRKARFANVDALTEQGYTQESIEDYITNGGPERLKHAPKDEWKNLGDGSGRLYKVDKDGNLLLAGEAKEKVYSTRERIENGNLITETFDKNGKVLGLTSTIYTPKSTGGGSGYRSRGAVVNIAYEKDDKGVPAVKVTTYQDGSTSREEVLPGKTGAKASAASGGDLGTEVKQQQYMDTLDETIEEVKKGGVTGPVDRAVGWLQSKLGVVPDVGNFSPARKARVQQNLQSIINMSMEEAKKIFGPQISNSDVDMMKKFAQIDLGEDEAVVVQALNRLRDYQQRLLDAGKARGGNTSTPAPAPQGKKKTVVTMADLE